MVFLLLLGLGKSNRRPPPDAPLDPPLVAVLVHPFVSLMRWPGRPSRTHHLCGLPWVVSGQGGSRGPSLEKKIRSASSRVAINSTGNCTPSPVIAVCG